LLSLTFWTACGIVCGVQIWISMIAHGHALWLVVLYQVLIWNMWFVFTPFIGRLARRYSVVPPTRRAVFVHALTALVLGPVHSAWWAMLLVAMRPYDTMGTSSFRHAYVNIAGSGLPLQLMVYCGVLAAHYAGDYYEKYREREIAAARLEASLSEARLYALELQIRPHFLFNTLNSISALTRASRNAEAVTMIAGLSDLLRYTLDHAGEQRVPLEDEVRITQRYLEIERTRFADRMSFSIDVAPDAKRAAVPTLILQPLAENAIRHGVARKAAAGRVEIKAFRDRDRDELRIEVFNTGALDPGYELGVGLGNTTDRLRHLYRDEHEFELREARGGVLASIRLPFSEVT
jgi:two-component system, LytTR family, sensor kinase